MTALKRWKDAKAREVAAQEERVAIESELVAEYGTGTHDIEGSKVRIYQNVTAKVDRRAWELVKDSIPEALRPVHYVEECKVEAAGVKWLKENEPGLWKLCASAITEKEGKPSFKVEK